MSSSHVTTSRNSSRKSPVLPIRRESATAEPGPLAAAAAQAAQRRPIDPETKRLMVAEAAYFYAEKRGFTPGGELQDWLDAEATIETMLGR